MHVNLMLVGVCGLKKLMGAYRCMVTSMINRYLAVIAFSEPKR